MLRRFQNRVGTAGLIVAIVALVAALSGGAYAASGGLSGKQKKEVEKIAKKYAGKPGTNGSNGATGPAGAPGAKGDTGAEGKQGLQGERGPRGEEGEEGVEGSPWTVGSLPGGKTETGMWAVGPEKAENTPFDALSFAVPLASTTGMSIHFINVAGEEEKFSEAIGPKPAACSGTAAIPTAAAGNLCVYETTRSGAFESGTGLSFESAQGGVKTVGSILFFNAEPGGYAYGSFAVTAPTS
jgi:hypothetical protein